MLKSDVYRCRLVVLCDDCLDRPPGGYLPGETIGFAEEHW